jgi:adenosylcobinamide-GDP ribazoletransferase
VAGICFAFTLMLAQYLKTQLGGLTGDTYGALTECGNVIYLLTAVFLLR